MSMLVYHIRATYGVLKGWSTCRSDKIHGSILDAWHRGNQRPQKPKATVGHLCLILPFLLHVGMDAPNLPWTTHGFNTQNTYQTNTTIHGTCGLSPRTPIGLLYIPAMSDGRKELHHTYTMYGGSYGQYGRWSHLGGTYTLSCDPIDSYTELERSRIIN
jgi:hypothetical protein